MAPRYELAVGLKRGHKTTKIERVGKVSGKELAAKSEKLRQARTKGVSNQIFIICYLLFYSLNLTYFDVLLLRKELDRK